MKVEFSYLKRQFAETKHEIMKRLESIVDRGDYTLGKEVKELEQKFANHCGTKYSVGMSNGTSALWLSLKALGIKPGDEVITVSSTFYATAASIDFVGAHPVFVDVNDEYLMDANQIEAKITHRTKAILPVQLTGNVCDMDKILSIAKRYDLKVVEDACQSVGAEYKGKKVGSFGDAGAFSFHPLKNLNVWGDGGIVTTNSKELYDDLCKWRNHGLKNRDVCEFFAVNERISTVQAAVALYLLENDLEETSRKRRDHAKFYDEALKDVPQIKIPPRNPDKKQVYHLYIVQAEQRDELLEYLNNNDENQIEAKIHYPIPVHLQPASKRAGLAYEEGDFPVGESQAKKIISLPLHQHLRNDERECVVEMVKKFYNR